MSFWFFSHDSRVPVDCLFLIFNVEATDKLLQLFHLTQSTRKPENRHRARPLAQEIISFSSELNDDLQRIEAKL